MFTDERFWDCECVKDYIHDKRNGNFCTVCKMFKSECPDSRVKEIPVEYHIVNDLKTEHRRDTVNG